MQLSKESLQYLWMVLFAVQAWSVDCSEQSDQDLLQQGTGGRGQMQPLVRDKIADGINGRSLVKATESFTIIPHYDSSITALSLQEQSIIKTVLIEGAAEWLSTVLKVRPMQTRIRFERACPDGMHYVVDGVSYCRESCEPETKCGPVVIPEAHLVPCRSCSTPGVQCQGRLPSRSTGVSGGHFVLYVSALQQPDCTSASLYSGTNFVQSKHCSQESNYDRPVAGYINFCPNALSIDQTTFPDQQQAVMHELIHALAFSEDLFPYFFNEEGFPRNPRALDGDVARDWDTGVLAKYSNTLRSVRRVDWRTLTPSLQHSVSLVVTPNVVREVRDHFNCSSLLGAELENQGGSAIAGQHWESRVFGEEIMTGTFSSSGVLSRVTLALLHDSGWYIPDYSHAGQLSWGRHKGCLFVQNSCGAWMDSADENKLSKAPYCDGLDYRNGRTGCANGRRAVGPCLIRNYTAPLPTDFQYLSRRRGGTQILADYCPLYGTWTFGDYRVGKSCLDPSHAPPLEDNFALESHGTDSRCFDQENRIRVSGEQSAEERQHFEKVDGKISGLCYKFSCSAKRILIEIGDQVVRCGQEGRKQFFTNTRGNATYKSSIVCPAYSELCEGYDCINRCSHHGACHSGRCYCHFGYTGEDCSQTYSQRLLSCSNISCVNGGNCSDSGRGFSCLCPANYTGAYCEQPAIPDPCIGVDCHGNGVCSRTDGGHSPKCVCYHGYDGRECGRTKDLCAANNTPCLNNGTCATNTTVCRCPAGYWGGQCEKVVNFCLPKNPCSPGELCTHHNSTQNYSCACPAGFLGPNCTDPILELCSSSPCARNGTCINTGYDYLCVCPRGWKGRQCLFKEAPCKRSPCGQGGRCKRLKTGSWGQVYCNCYDGYHGELCQYHTQSLT